MEHAPFHFHIDFYIDVSGVDMGVAQPVADHIDIVTCPQQVHGGGMAEGMGVDGFGGHGWALTFGCGGVLAGDVPYPEAGERGAVGIEEELLGGRIFWGSSLAIIVESLDGFGPQGATPNLLALAKEFDLSGAIKAQVGSFQGYDLAYPSPCIVE